MSRLTHHEYNPLMQSHKTALRCGKCGLCRYIDNNEIQNIRFSFICPSGVKFKFEEYWGSGKSEMLRGLITQLGATTTEIEINERFLHALYTCTTCAGCQIICESIGKEPLKTIMSLREKVVLEEETLEPHEKMIENILQSGNPWGNPAEERSKWLKSVKAAKDLNKEKAEVMFFVGCAPYKKELKESTLAAAKILAKTGADFGTLGASEQCCGIALARIGDRANFVKLAKQNLEKIKSTGVQKIITACACCFQTLRDEYEEIHGDDLPFEVLHITEYIDELLEDGKLKLKKPPAGLFKGKTPRVTYHDPCNLGRYTRTYKPPRNILNAVKGIKFVEFHRNKQNAWCCGAGGGGETAVAFPDFTKWVASERIEEAKDIKAENIVTACPFCEDMLSRAAGKKMQVMDIATMVAKLI
ncbi:MAG: (Fe-S)-binding protein [bacterium]